MYRTAALSGGRLIQPWQMCIRDSASSDTITSHACPLFTAFSVENSPLAVFPAFVARPIRFNAFLLLSKLCHLLDVYKRQLLDCKAYSAAKEKGLVRLEGKEYVVKDGDVILFRFNV